MTALRWFFFLWCCGYLLCAGCAHRLKSHQTANRVEQETRQFQTAETAASQTQSVAAEKKTGSKRTREFDPKTGHLIRDVLEQYQSDGRVTTTANDSSHVVSTGHDFRSVKASSSSARVSDTKVGWWSPWWLLLLIPLAAGAWALRKWIRARIPFL